MTDLLTRLQTLPKKIRVGVVGVGNIGRGIVYQAGITPGIECVAIADAHLKNATAWAARLGCEYVVVENLRDMHAAIHRGRLAVCSDGTLIAQCEQVDVLIDSSTGGAQFALTAIANHKHVVMMNSEGGFDVRTQFAGTSQEGRCGLYQCGWRSAYGTETPYE